MNKDQILGVVRHLMTALGGAATIYFGTNDAVVQQAVSAAITVAGFVWGAAEKTPTKDGFLSGLRHSLTAAGGIVVASGVADESMIQEGVGLLVALAGFTWSIVDKVTKK